MKIYFSSVKYKLNLLSSINSFYTKSVTYKQINYFTDFIKTLSHDVVKLKIYEKFYISKKPFATNLKKNLIAT